MRWDAYADLQHALAPAESGDETPVAAGLYTPADSEDRPATFQLTSGVEIYGGSFFPNQVNTASQK